MQRLSKGKIIDYASQRNQQHTCSSALSGWVLYRQLELTKLSCPDLLCCAFVHTKRCPSELGISMHAEGSKNISPWISRFISDSITLDMLHFGEVINGTDIRPDSTHLS